MNNIIPIQSSNLVRKINDDILDIQRDYFKNKNLFICLPVFNNFTQCQDLSCMVQLNSQWNFTLIDEENEIYNTVTINSNYQFITSNDEFNIYYNKVEFQLTIFEKFGFKEIRKIYFEIPANSIISGSYFHKFLIISTSKDYYSKIFIFDYWLDFVKNFEIFNYSVSNIHCINNQMIYLECYGANYKRAIYFFDENFSLILKRFLYGYYVDGIFETGKLIINKYYIHNDPQIYNWQTDESVPIISPPELVVNPLDKIRFFGRYGFNKNKTDQILERYTISEENRYLLSERKIIDNEVVQFGYNVYNTNPNGCISYSTNKFIILRKIDTLEIVIKIPKEKEVRFSHNSLIIIKKNDNNDILQLTDFKTSRQEQVKIPHKHFFRNSLINEQFLYFSFDEDNKGVGRFDFSTGEVIINHQFQRIRQMVKIGNKILAASWEGVLEYTLELREGIRFPTPENVKAESFRGHRLFLYQNLVIYGGYTWGANKSDNFILIYDGEKSLIEQIVDKGSSNGYSLACDVDYVNGIFYYVSKDSDKNIIRRYDLLTMSHLKDLSIDVPLYRDIVIHGNFLYGATLLQVKNKNFIDIIQIDSEQKVNEIEISTGFYNLAGMSQIDSNTLILNIYQGQYYILKISGSSLILDNEIKNVSGGTDVGKISGLKDVIILNCTDQKLIFYNLSLKRKIGEMCLYGKDIIFTIVGEKWLYTSNPSLLSCSVKDKFGLEKFLSVESEDRNSYFKIYNSLDMVSKILFNYEQQAFDKMRAEYFSGSKFPKMLT